eukprot:UN25109
MNEWVEMLVAPKLTKPLSQKFSMHYTVSKKLLFTFNASIAYEITIVVF